MSGRCVAPGPGSLQALGWLARVGAAPFEALQLVIGCSATRAHDHVHRLIAAGLARRVAMTRGQGSLILITPAGARASGLPASGAPRSVAPTSWAHASACAWVSAWLQVRGRAWVSEREVLADEFWRHDLRYQDHRGSARVTHRPDLGVQTKGGPVAVEVELQRKTLARLRGICAMYKQLTQADDGPLAGVIYVTDRHDVAQLVARTAAATGLDAPALSLRTLQDVVEQTRAAAARPASPTAGRGAVAGGGR